MSKGQGYFEEADPVTGKAKEHQRNALKGKNISNAEIKPQSNGCAEKVKDKLDDWEPNSETVEDLIDLLNELDECSDYDRNDPYELESRLSVADGYQEFADDNADFPVWTVDYEGNALTGEDGGDIKHVNEIDPEYFAMHGFTAEEVVEIQNTADAKMLDDKPYDDMRGKIYQFDDGSEWIVSESSEAAEKQAVEYVRWMLDDEPEIFDQGWLQEFITMTETDMSDMANGESAAYVEGLTDDEALEEAGFDEKSDELQEEIDVLESEIEDLEEKKADLESTVEDEGDENGELTGKINDIESEISGKMNEIHLLGKKQEALPDEAKEKVQEDKYDEIYEELEDPIQYFVRDQGTYSKEDLMNASFITMDLDEAAQDAIDTDGVGHFLASYDFNEVEVGDTSMVMFRTN